MSTNKALGIAGIAALVVLAVGLTADDITGTDNTLRPFDTDGCSEFPDGTFEQRTLWRDCCIAHDKAYWLGGDYAARQQADDALRACVAAVGEPEIAAVMLAGVRVGGSPYWLTRYRWGYGWPYWDGWKPRGYKELNDDEQQQAAALISAD